MCSKAKETKPKMGIINFGACPKDWDHILLIGQLKKKKKPHQSIHHQRKTTKLWQLEVHHENSAKNKGLNMKRGWGAIPRVIIDGEGDTIISKHLKWFHLELNLTRAEESQGELGLSHIGTFNLLSESLLVAIVLTIIWPWFSSLCMGDICSIYN